MTAPALPRATGRRWIVLAGLVTLMPQTAVVGVWAGFAPSSFVADFPVVGMQWVVTGHADNEHFVSDVGFIHLALCVIAGRLLWQELSTRATGLKPFAAAWSAYAIPHFVFHLAHRDDIHGTALVTSLTALALAVLEGAVLVLNTDEIDGPAERKG